MQVPNQLCPACLFLKYHLFTTRGSSELVLHTYCVGPKKEHCTVRTGCDSVQVLMHDFLLRTLSGPHRHGDIKSLTWLISDAPISTCGTKLDSNSYKLHL